MYRSFTNVVSISGQHSSVCIVHLASALLEGVSLRPDLIDFALIYIIKIEIFGFYFFVLPTDPRKSVSRRSEKLKINYVWPKLVVSKMYAPPGLKFG